MSRSLGLEFVGSEIAMKVVLKQMVPKLGKEGQVVNVADGYARNFLFPRGLAALAHKGELARLERLQKKFESDLEKTRLSAGELGEKLNGLTVRVTGNTAKGQTKLFGAITSADISDAIKEAIGIEIDRHKIVLLHPIKRIGVYEVAVDLHRDVDAVVKVEVADQDGNLGLAIGDEVAKPEAKEAPEKGAEKDHDGSSSATETTPAEA
jgi:large subunit ribosomal protein L9